MLHKYLMFRLKDLHLKCIATLNFPKNVHIFTCVYMTSLMNFMIHMMMITGNFPAILESE